MSDEAKKLLYHCGGCNKDIIEDDMDYEDCPNCGEGTEKYKFVKEVTEIPEGAVMADTFGDDEEDEEVEDVTADAASDADAGEEEKFEEKTDGDGAEVEVK